MAQTTDKWMFFDFVLHVYEKCECNVSFVKCTLQLVNPIKCLFQLRIVFFQMFSQNVWLKCPTKDPFDAKRWMIPVLQRFVYFQQQIRNTEGFSLLNMLYLEKYIILVRLHVQTNFSRTKIAFCCFRHELFVSLSSTD